MKLFEMLQLDYAVLNEQHYFLNNMFLRNEDMLLIYINGKLQVHRYKHINKRFPDNIFLFCKNSWTFMTIVLLNICMVG